MLGTTLRWLCPLTLRTDGHAPLGGTTAGTGYGSHGTTGYGSNTTAGPHDSNLANKADPRVDSDRGVFSNLASLSMVADS